MSYLLLLSQTPKKKAGDAGLTYEGAYINRSGETGASNKTLSLKFTETVPTGSDYTTGMTIEVTADNGSSYETLNLSSTTQAVVDTNYVQYTLTGTVDTFQGLSGTEGQQVRISYDGSQTWNSGTITNVTTLTNASTINLLEDIVEVWHLADLTAEIDAADDLTDNNVVTFVAGKLGDGAQMSRTGPKYLSHADSSVFSRGDTNFTWSFWVKFDTVSLWQYLIAKWTWAGPTNAEYMVYVESGNSKVHWVKRDPSNVNALVTSPTVLTSTSTWYNIVAYHDADNNEIGIIVNDTAATPVITDTGIGDHGLDIAFGAPADGNAAGAVAGIMDEIALHSKVLSADEITDLDNGGDGKAYPYIPDHT